MWLGDLLLSYPAIQVILAMVLTEGKVMVVVLNREIIRLTVLTS
jgi:hypothetical protein